MVWNGRTRPGTIKFFRFLSVLSIHFSEQSSCLLFFLVEVDYKTGDNSSVVLKGVETMARSRSTILPPSSVHFICFYKL